MIAGTTFQDSKLPLTLWFRAMWQVTPQKNDVIGMGLQRVLAVGSYKMAWKVRRKLRRAKVRPGCDQLCGAVEMDQAYWGGEEVDVHGRKTYEKALIAVAAEVDGAGIGRIRLRHIPDTSLATLHGFVAKRVERGVRVQTDVLQPNRQLNGYVRDWRVQKSQAEDVPHLLLEAHRVISLLKRCLLGAHRGAIGADCIQNYLDEFTFRFNRRTSARSALATGMYPSDCNSICNSTVSDGSHPSWPARLRNVGYQCFASSKMDFNPAVDCGFDETATAHGHAHYPEITAFLRHPLCMRIDVRSYIGGRSRPGPSTDAAFVKHTLDFIRRQRPGGQPWAVHCGLNLPHPPFIAWQRLIEQYSPSKVELAQVTAADLERLHPVYQQMRHFTNIAIHISDDTIRRASAAY